MTLGGRSEASAYLKKEGLRLATKRAEEELKFLGVLNKAMIACQQCVVADELLLGRAVPMQHWLSDSVSSQHMSVRAH